MAYTPANLSLGFNLLGGKFGVWCYQSTDTFAGTVNVADYITNALDAGMREGDMVFCSETDQDPPTLTLAYVSAIGATGLGTLTALVATGGAASVTNLTATGTVLLGDAAADLVGFYGGTGASQRASSIQASSALASSTDFGVTQLAIVQEIMNTLTGLKLWKGAA